MSRLMIHIKMGKDGPDCLTCVRPDETCTRYCVNDFFPRHDLSHLAAETVVQP